MPRFCIDSCLLGTQRHLVVEGEQVSWATDVPDDAYHFTGQLKDASDWCLDTVLKLSGAAVTCTPPARFTQAMSLVLATSTGVPVPWQKVMPSREHRAFIRRLVEDLKAAMDPGALDFYRGTWVPGNAVFRALVPAAVDGARWRDILLAKEGNLPAAESFRPGKDGFARPVSYDRFGAVTGRLTVADGPQILTLKRDHRDMLASRHGKDGSVVSVDFAALEARVLLYEAGGSCDDVDLYGALSKQLGTLRSVVKLLVISRLYGRSVHNVKGVNGSALKAAVKHIDSQFGLPTLLKRVKAEFVSTGHVTNKYGRRVRVDEPLDHVLVNYFAQSTGVDVTLLGFSQVVQRLKETAPRTLPVFLLHDAMLLDVHNDELAEVQKVDSVRVPGYEQAFPLKVSRVSR